MEKVRFGVIGLGDRGFGLLRDQLVEMDEIKVVALCDVYEDRVQQSVDLVKEKNGHTPAGYTDYEALLDDENVEAVLVATGWECHNEVAIRAMEKHKGVALEVGGAFDVKELWDLVDAYERTKTPVMMLENSCFNWVDMTVTSMARDGIFGDIVHCSGCYAHDLRWLLANAWKNRNYRLDNYIKRNCENYPTHDLGPIAKILDINRGNRMVSLVSVASRAAGLKAYIKKHPEIDETLENITVKQGDIVNTIITCANGETIALRLDTTLPRPFSRELVVRGTDGMYEGDPNMVFLDGESEVGFNNNCKDNTSDKLNSLSRYMDKYLPQCWREFADSKNDFVHFGQDRLVLRVFAENFRRGEEMPIDIYDTAAWMSITCLSEQSIALGGAPVAIPDFTRGKWMTRKRKDVIDFTKDIQGR